MNTLTLRLAVEVLAKSYPAIELTLAISTAHIKPTTNVADLDVISYPHGEYGYLINVPRDAESWDELQHKNIPDDLMMCMSHAKDLGCSWLLLDRDATRIEELPLHTW